MAESLTEVGIKIFQLLVILFIIFKIYTRKRHHKINALNWYLAIYILAAMQGFVELLIYYIKVYVLNIEHTSYFRFNEFHSIPYGLAIFVIYLLSEFMNDQTPHPIRLGVVITSWASYFSIMLFQTFSDYSIVFTDVPASKQFFNFLFDIYQFIAMSFTSYIFWKSWKNSKNEQNRRASFAVFFALFIYVVVLFYEIGEQILGFPDIYGALSFSLTFIIMAYVTIKYPYFVFTVPPQIYRIILATKSGIHIYSADLEINDKNSSDELLAGGVTAITSFLSEVAGSSKSLKYAVLGDRTLIVSRYEEIIGFIIADKSTFILKSALDQFVREFYHLYEKELNELLTNVSQFKEARSIISRCFPFVEARDILEFWEQHINQ